MIYQDYIHIIHITFLTYCTWFEKTTISGFFGYADHSKWFIGHAGSHIGEKKTVKKKKFSKIELCLTFQYVSQLERDGADLQISIDRL